jgi:peroxiredoxin
MSLVESNMLDLGIAAPDFNLPDTVSGKNLTFADVKGEKGTVVMFICNHCPYVIHVNAEIKRISDEYSAKGIGFVAISSNDIVNYPQDAPHLMTKLVEQENFNFPYLYDESQEVAKAYDAACTPDFYVFDAENTLVYRGRIDASRPSNGQPLTGKDLREALDSVVAGESVSDIQYPSAGCNIKWKK